MSSDDPASAPHRDRTPLVILAVLAVLVLVALIVVFTRDRPAPLDAATPGGVVQRYATAVLDGDEDLAAGYLTASARTGCDGPSSFTEDIRLTLLGTTLREASADVRVAIVTSSEGGLFGPDEYRTDDVFGLVRVDGDWLIDRAPWQLSVCPDAPTDLP